jgi:hypothetical protein
MTQHATATARPLSSSLTSTAEAPLPPPNQARVLTPRGEYFGTIIRADYGTDEITIRHASGASVVVSLYALESTALSYEFKLAYDIDIEGAEHATPELEGWQPAQVEGQKHDEGKLDWTLLPPEALEEVVKVLQHGAVKYGRDNWQRVPDGRRRYIAAAHRHLHAVSLGELTDPESGLPHLAHAVCSLLFAGYFE